MGTLMCSCAEVREPIKLSFGVVGIGLGIHVLDAVHVPQGNGRFWGFWSH